MAGLKQASPWNKYCFLSHSDQNKPCPAVSAHLKIQRLWEIWPQCNFKACVRYFLSKFYFSTNDGPSKVMKNVFYLIYKALFVLEIFKFLCFLPHLFFQLSAIALNVDWFKTNVKVYSVIICLNQSLIISFAWCLEKEIRGDIETLFIDIALIMEHFYVKIVQKIWPEVTPRPLYNFAK